MANDEDEEKLACPICYKVPAAFLGETIIVTIQQQGGSQTRKTAFPCNDCFRDRWVELQEHLLPEDTFFRLKQTSCITCGHKFQTESRLIGPSYCSIGCRERIR